MRSRENLVYVGLSLLVVLAGLLLWEFAIEDVVKALFFPTLPADTAGQRWQTIEIGLVAAAIGAVVPTGIALGLAVKHARAMRELALAEERVKVIEANPDWLWEVDENAVYTYAGAKVRDLLGYEPEEIIGKTPFDLMPPEEAARVAVAFGAITAERRPFSLLENINRHKDGRLVTVETSGVPILDRKGVFRGYRGIDRDVTEHKAKDRRLAEQKALLEAVFEAIPDAVAATDLDRRLTAVNGGFTSVFRCGQDDAIGYRSAKFYADEGEFHRQGRLRYNAAAEGPSAPFIVEFRRKDGTTFPAEVRVAPIRDAAGAKIGYVSVGRDIGERLAMERRLIEQKALLEAVFEAIPDAVGTADLDRRMITVNRGFTELFGYTPDEVVGRKTAFLYESEEEFRRLGELRYNLAADGPSPVYVIGQRRKNGEVFPAEIRGGAIRDAAGDKIGYLAVIRDVGERLAMERRLREVSKMEAIGQLTAGIAHDYNNLLQVIQGSLDLANHLVGGGNRQVRDLLRNALEASHRGARITRQLLSFGRRDVLYTRSVAVGELVEGLLDALKGMLGDAVLVVADTDPGLPPIAVDPQSLEAALLHIADNARAAMPQGGTLTIRATARHLDGDLAIEDGKLAAGAYVEIAVTDTGCGMSERVRQKAFEPFFTTRAPGEHSGLGLSVVQGFARQSGGHASLSSTIGEGTTVALLLPAADAGAD